MRCLIYQIKYMDFKFIFLFFISLFYSISTFSQIRIGEWQDHLPYNKAIDVAEAKSKIYTATPYALIVYNKNDHTIQKLSKVNGLSDIGLSCIGYSAKTSTLVVGYSNGNLDLIQSSSVINLADIKRKQLYGSKAINNILMIDKYAYLSTGFGIVKVNLDKKEISDTYFIGANASYINVNDLTYDGSYFYAATEQGIYKAFDSSNLADFNNWTLITYLPYYNKEYTKIAYYTPYFYSVLKTSPDNDNWLIRFNSSSWTLLDSSLYNDIRNLNVSNNKLIIAHDTTITIFQDTIVSNYYSMLVFTGSTSGWHYTYGENGIYDTDGNLWVADQRYGLINIISNSNTVSYYPNGPSSYDAYDISSAGNEIWVAKGGLNISGANLWNAATIYAYYNYSWHTLTGSNMAGKHDIVTVLVNPSNPSVAYAGSWNDGIFEFYNHQSIKQYDETNSTLEPFYGNDVKIADLAFDSQQNLWVLNPGVNNPVSVKKTDGTWKSFNYSYISNDLRKFIITQDDIKWVVLGNGQGILIFDNGDDIDNESDDNVKKISILDEGGTLITNDVYSIAEDLDGVIWIGTNQGVVTYYNPNNVFIDENFYADRVLLDLGDGTAQYLLKYETVTSIAIDGANRKWFGTANSGVFLLSDDCSSQILHFTQNDSPLFSDKIKNITINQTTGEVFFVTDKGLISYRNDATEGLTTFNSPYAFPNPVSENYNGLISLIGLVHNAHVKITDIAGNLVYETNANGGMATWNGKNFQGNRVNTGVYLAFCSNDDGSETKVVKILIIK